jgi:hypothetical protein
MRVELDSEISFAFLIGDELHVGLETFSKRILDRGSG